MNLFRSALFLPHESFRVIKQDRFYAIIPMQCNAIVWQLGKLRDDGIPIPSRIIL